jgi:hypothetical protein
MLWLIWIAIMLLVPIITGVYVWFQMNRLPVEVSVTTSAVGITDSRS